MDPARLAEDYVKSDARTIGDIMTHDVAVVEQDAPLHSAVDVMERRRVKRLPVVKAGKLVGILSRANVLVAFVYKARSEKADGATDGGIRKAILDEFEKTNGCMAIAWQSLYAAAR